MGMEEKNEMREIIANNIKRLRKAEGISQVTLAKRVGLTHNFVNDIEKEKKSVSMETIGRLAKTFEVEPYQLLLTPKQWSNAENSPIIGYMEIIKKNVDRVFDNSLKEYNEYKMGKEEQRKRSEKKGKSKP